MPRPLQADDFMTIFTFESSALKMAKYPNEGLGWGVEGEVRRNLVHSIDFWGLGYFVYKFSFCSDIYIFQ